MSPFLERLRYRAVAQGLISTASSAGIVERHGLVLRARLLYAVSERPEFKLILDRLWASGQFRAIETILDNLGAVPPKTQGRAGVVLVEA